MNEKNPLHEKDNPISQPHDAFFKANLANPQRARDLIEAHLPHDLVKRIDWKTLQPQSTEFIQHNLSKVTSDSLYACRINQKEAYIYYLWEHQSSPQPLMPFRLLTYTLQIMQQHMNKGHKKLPLVIPAVLYHGVQSPYPYSRDIIDCFEDIEAAKQYALRPCHLIDLTVTSDDTIAHLSANLQFEYLLKHCRDEGFAEKLMDFIKLYPKLADYFLSGDKHFLNIILSYIETRKNNTVNAIEKLIETIDSNTGGKFMNTIQRWEEKAKQQGIEQGMEKGMEKGMRKIARNLLAKDKLSIAEIAEVSGLSEAAVHALSSH